LVSSNPDHSDIIQQCIRAWQLRTANKQRTLATFLDRFKHYDERVHLREPLELLKVQIIDTSRELVRCQASLRFWTDVSRGTVEGPLFSMMTTDAGRIRAIGYLPPQYVSQLRAEVAALPRRVDRSSLAVFRSL
jgi:hypothetical protein